MEINEELILHVDLDFEWQSPDKKSAMAGYKGQMCQEEFKH